MNTTDAILAALLSRIRADRDQEDKAIARVAAIIGRYQKARTDMLAELAPVLTPRGGPGPTIMDLERAEQERFEAFRRAVVTNSANGAATENV